MTERNEIAHTMSSSSKDAKDRRLIDVWDLYGAVQCLLSILCKASLNLQASRKHTFWYGILIHECKVMSGGKPIIDLLSRSRKVPSASHLAVIGVLKSPCKELSSIGILPPAGLAIVTLYPASCKVDKFLRWEPGWLVQQTRKGQNYIAIFLGNSLPAYLKFIPGSCDFLGPA